MMGKDSGYRESDQKAKSSAIEFTPEDVEANRQGKLSTRQNGLRSPQKPSPVDTMEFNQQLRLFALQVMLILYLVIAIPAVILGRADSKIVFVTLIACFIFLWSVLSERGKGKQKLNASAIKSYRRIVLHLDGVPRIQQMPGSTRLIIHGQSFNIKPAAAAFFSNPGTYRIYYLSGSGRFLISGIPGG